MPIPKTISTGRAALICSLGSLAGFLVGGFAAKDTPQPSPNAKASAAKSRPAEPVNFATPAGQVLRVEQAAPYQSAPPAVVGANGYGTVIMPAAEDRTLVVTNTGRFMLRGVWPLNPGSEVELRPTDFFGSKDLCVVKTRTCLAVTS